MNRLLADLRIVEISAFVAAPLGGMTMAQMGAEVIRIDPIGGGIDFNRWPVAPSGASLYWAGMNKAKRSVALALDKPEGRALAQAIATAPGPGAGIVLTNLPPLPGLDYASLKAKREDVILLRLIGNRDGTAAVDYTVNAASGFPLVTGQSGSTGGPPVNNVLPVWDMDLTLKEMTRLREKGITGFTITDKPQVVGMPDLDSPYFAPMWALGNEMGAVFNFHIGSGNGRAHRSND